MRFITRNSTLKLLLKGAKSPSKDEDVKIYWFPSLVHNVWTIGENFNDFKDFKDFDDFKDSAELFRQIRSPKKTSRTFLQKHWTFSKKRGRFSQKRWTFSEKRWTFSKKSPTFFVLYPCFFVLELWWNNPLVWRLWKQKVQNPCNVRAWYALTHARENQPKGYAKEYDHLLYEKNKQVRTLLRKWREGGCIFRSKTAEFCNYFHCNKNITHLLAVTPCNFHTHKLISSEGLSSSFCLMNHF